jgi:hypothetical protein
LYHRSPFDIKNYDHNHAVSIRDDRSTHNNSVLGLWTSTFPDKCKSFGEFNYQINNLHGLIKKGLDLRTFFNLTSNLEVKEQLILREKILETCDVIYIIDNSKNINEVIILSTDKISIKKVSNTLPDKKYILSVC